MFIYIFLAKTFQESSYWDQQRKQLYIVGISILENAVLSCELCWREVLGGWNNKTEPATSWNHAQ
jgi:hypothetical protein